ncbi:MAG TPA: ATP-binding cassette domain-containing protein [Pyrinomonadaceae bacterium]|nr:ATP-binding cassette domain-containing protein [Pyrinomonadaceae bacterium]
MKQNCIETIGLTHKFSADETALDNINLHVQTGSIYGFLGPNGAGKTTTLKLILGLLKKQQGEILVFGKPIERNRVETLKKIGAMIESPSIYGHLTATENLRILQKVYDCPKNRIAEVLNLVGLANTGSKKASQFSLGMKQRLSIAIALLNHPSLLIFDEPTNGLDPNGIIEIRELLKDLAKKQGISILISSHILSEIEKLVTHVGIINHSKLLFQGTLSELVSKQKQSSYISFQTSDKNKALEVFEKNKIACKTENEKIFIPLIEKETIARINEQMVYSRIDVYAIEAVKSDLEQIFFDVIKN